MRDLSCETLKLDYPCSWKYKLVVKENSNIKNIVKSIIDKREHKISKSKTSSKGKFVSHTLELLVFSDDDRKSLYELLGKHDEIKMIV